MPAPMDHSIPRSYGTQDQKKSDFQGEDLPKKPFWPQGL